MDAVISGSNDRECLTRAARLICDTGQANGVVRNLTSGGALFESDHRLAVNEKVLLDIQGMGPVGASVAWSMGERAGLRFDCSRG